MNGDSVLEHSSTTDNKHYSESTRASGTVIKINLALARREERRKKTVMYSNVQELMKSEREKR